MSYSNPRTTIYLDPVEQDFGAGTGTAWSFKGPSGKQGSLKNIGLQVTETFADDQTTGKVLIGTTADPNYYGQLEITDGTVLTNTFNDQDDSNCVIIEALPADTQIEVTFVQCVDSGTAAGKGYPYVNVEWY
jgi:hypothetical protein|tara:strand:- start:102 stop:497 length:396 start_codon:yes stop_codon:yes gene_type:complete